MRSAAILAGGRASRFGGRDKSALVVDGRAIIERQVAELSPVVDDIKIVGPRAERAQAFQSRSGAPSRLLANVNTSDEYAGLDALQSHKL